jgi:hypothetical protein
VNELVGPATTLGAFVYDRADPAQGELHFRRWAEGQPVDEQVDAPGLVIVAADGRLTDSERPEATHAEIAVLVDAAADRILIAPQHLLRATLTRLLLLGPRYATRFEPFDDRTSALGDHVVTWRIRWDEPPH